MITTTTTTHKCSEFQYTQRIVVSLNDPNYFCNKSWTLSYNMNTKSWISFHSYIPNWYIAENNFFYSGINGCCEDFDFIATVFVTTTSTSTTYIPDCRLQANSHEVTTTTTSSTSTTTSTSSSTTTTTTTEYICHRPTGLMDYSLVTGYTLITPPVTFISTGSKDEACTAEGFLLNYNTETDPNGLHITVLQAQAYSISIGQTLYLGWNTTDCIVIPDGWYFTEELMYQHLVFHVIGGKIVEISSCLSTTTTSSTSTTTTTAIPIPINCGETVSYNTESIYENVYTIALGASTGISLFDFDAGITPDRFIIVWNGIQQFDTGYYGSSDYDFGGINRSYFNFTLLGKIDPITTNIYPDIITYPDDGYPRVISPAIGGSSFNKTDVTPENAQVYIYSPINNSTGNFKLWCLGVTTTTTTIIESTTTTTTELSTTTTTTTLLPILIITNPQPVCSPLTVDITDPAVTIGSTIGLSLTYWTNAGATIPYATPTEATGGTYYIKGTDGNGNYDIEPVNVTINRSPDVVITNPLPVYFPETVDLTNPMIKAWSTDGLIYTYWLDYEAINEYTTPEEATAGVYYIKGTVPETGCFDIKPVIVTVLEATTTTTSTTASIPTTTTTTTETPTTTTTTTIEPTTTTTTTTATPTTTTTTTDPLATTTTTTTDPLATTTTTTTSAPTTTTTTSTPSTTTTTTIAPTTTTTTTATPTTTTTTTLAPTTTTTTTINPLPLSECGVFLVTDKDELYTYEPSVDTATYRTAVPSHSIDIARWGNYLYISGNGVFNEYEITLNPFSISASVRQISYINGPGNGLCNKNSSTLIGSSGTWIYSYDITTTTAVETQLFNMTTVFGGNAREVVGDILYNANNNSYIISNKDTVTNKYYISEVTDTDGIYTKFSDILISESNIDALYQSTYGVLPVTTFAIHKTYGSIYRVTLSGLAVLGSLTGLSGLKVIGAAQDVSCITIDLPVTTTTTTTSTPTTTTTTTSTPTTTTTTTRATTTTTTTRPTTTTTTTKALTTTTTTRPATTTTTTTHSGTTTTTTSHLTTTTTTTIVPTTTSTTTIISPTTTTTTTRPVTTTTTTTAAATTTTTTTAGITTTTTTITPTTTTTTTTLDPTPVTECAVFIISSSGNIYTYEPSTNTSIYRFATGTGSPDVANTETKLWVIGLGYFKEYDITLSPFTAVYNRTIWYTHNPGAGLSNKDANTLIGTYNNYVYLYDITGSSTIETLAFAMGGGRITSGDIIYNSISDTYIISNNIGASQYITEFSSTGTIIKDISTPVGGILGLFEYDSKVYAIRFGSPNSSVYEVTLSGLVLANTITGINVYGASQDVTCVTVDLPTTTTTTTYVPDCTLEGFATTEIPPTTTTTTTLDVPPE